MCPYYSLTRGSSLHTAEDTAEDLCKNNIAHLVDLNVLMGDILILGANQCLEVMAPALPSSGLNTFGWAYDYKLSRWLKAPNAQW